MLGVLSAAGPPKAVFAAEYHQISGRCDYESIDGEYGKNERYFAQAQRKN